MKYNVFKERDNTVYCFGHPIGLDLPKMSSPPAVFSNQFDRLFDKVNNIDSNFVGMYLFHSKVKFTVQLHSTKQMELKTENCIDSIIQILVCD
jgi:hypothetical protein